MNSYPDAAPQIASTPVPSPPDAPASESWVVRLLRLLRREPGLLVTVAYLLVSFVGVWCSYWFYSSFGLPILSYMQAGDFLVAGLRDPTYLAWLAGYGVLMAAVTWPAFYWRKRPEHVAAIRQRLWGRIVFPRNYDPMRAKRAWKRAWSWSPETALAFGLLWGGIWILMGYVLGKAERIKSGGGDHVQVTMAGSSQPLAGEARLLGTTSGYVLLYWPDDKRAEAVSADAIGRIQSLPRRKSPVAAPKAAPAAMQ
jgi:hypothetical protein